MPFISVELKKSDTDTIKDEEEKKEEANEAGLIETWHILNIQIGEMALNLHK